MSQSYAEILRLADSNAKSAAQQVRRTKDLIENKYFLFIFRLKTNDENMKN
jgi:hypothetical protein